jgi:MT0933-like antitoxin protein
VIPDCKELTMAETSKPGDEGGTILDKAKELAEEVGDKVKGMITEHHEKIDNAVDKAGDFIDDKTKGRFSDKIGKATDAAHNAVTKLSGNDQPGDTGTKPSTGGAGGAASGGAAGAASGGAAGASGTTDTSETRGASDKPDAGGTGG